MTLKVIGIPGAKGLYYHVVDVHTGKYAASTWKSELNAVHLCDSANFVDSLIRAGLYEKVKKMLPVAVNDEPPK